MAPSIDVSRFHQAFFEESLEGLQLMETLLLDLSVDSPDTEEVNAIFRAAHSIKGGSSSFGFHEVAGLTHVLETLLDEVRGGRQIDAKTVDLILETVDCLVGMLTALRDGDRLQSDRVLTVQGRLAACLHVGEEQSRVSNTASGAANGASASKSRGWRIEFRPHRRLLQTGNDPLHIVRELMSLGSCQVAPNLESLPALAQLAPEDSYLAWTIELEGDIDVRAVQGAFAWVDGECDLIVTALQTGDTAGPTSEASSAGAKGSSGARGAGAESDDSEREWDGRERRGSTDRATPKLGGDSSSIRVGTDKVDNLVDIVGELVITHAMLSQIVENFQPDSLEALRGGLSQLRRTTREMQDSVMRIRMLPVSFVFARLPRLVHELSATLDKVVELDVQGGQTEVDKTILERIGDPLTHLIRNCMDHGVEPRAVRREKGKPETGHVRVHAYHQGGSIIIEVGDDGAGIDRDRLITKAKELGLMARDEVFSDERVLDLIFHPGLSTAQTLSDVSGRGVGMDVVRRNVRDLGGAVELRSVRGEGTTFKIRLPLTLAIVDGQLVRVAKETFVIPLVAMIESSQLDPNLVSRVPGRADVYQFRGVYIPIVRLSDAFQLDVSRRPGNAQDSERPMLAVVEGGGGA